MAEEWLDETRNKALSLHRNYKSRPDPASFDDTSLKDEWQDGVYKAAWETALRNGYHRIVDFGCGSGYKLIKYFSVLDTIGYEVQPTLAFLKSTYPQKRWEDSSELARVSLDGDILICSDVIEHLVDPLPLLQKLGSATVRYIFLSTPALDILADRGWSPRFGPPGNPSHVNEWTTQEFRNLVEPYLRVFDHTVVSVEHCTQLIVAWPKRRRVEARLSGKI
jgi:hypothetical protein